MKNLLLLLLFCLPVLSGCSSDDEDKSSLSETTWVCDEVGGNYHDRRTIVFRGNTYNLTEEYVSSSYKVELVGTYTYDHPNVIMTENGKTITAVISGNEMTVDNGFKRVYEKQ